MSIDGESSTTRRREVTRQRLLDAAEQVFAESGLEAAALEEICERAGYTRGAFYSNFASKEQLFLELCARTARDQIAAVRERIVGVEAGSVSADAAQLVAAVLEVAGDERHDVLLFGEIRLYALRTPALAAAYVQQNDVLLESVGQIVDDIARAKGVTLRTDPLGAARILLATWSAAAEEAVLRGLEGTRLRHAVGEALADVTRMLLGEE